MYHSTVFSILFSSDVQLGVAGMKGKLGRSRVVSKNESVGF